jgi:hypothetical protein
MIMYPGDRWQILCLHIDTMLHQLDRLCVLAESQAHVCQLFHGPYISYQRVDLLTYAFGCPTVELRVSRRLHTDLDGGIMLKFTHTGQRFWMFRTERSSASL